MQFSRIKISFRISILLFSGKSPFSKYDGCEWVFINLNSMVYAPGMPGVKIVAPIRDLNGISTEDFKTIWEIFKYRENHLVRDEYTTLKTGRETTGISPAISKGAHLCHIYKIADEMQFSM